MLTSSYKSSFARLTTLPARLLIGLRISPNALTLAGFAGVSLSCWYYAFRNRNTLLFCGLVLACGLCDALDGAVARLMGHTTQWGSYLDAMMDRYTEAVIALTVAWVSGYWLLISLVLVGSLLISYAKARASMEVRIANTEWPDLMERTERGVLFLLGFAVSALLPWRPAGRDLFWWTLVGLVIAVHATVVQRMWRARHFMLTRGSDGR